MPWSKVISLASTNLSVFLHPVLLVFGFFLRKHIISIQQNSTTTMKWDGTSILSLIVFGGGFLLVILVGSTAVEKCAQKQQQNKSRDHHSHVSGHSAYMYPTTDRNWTNGAISCLPTRVGLSFSGKINWILPVQCNKFHRFAIIFPIAQFQMLECYLYSLMIWL